MRGGVTEWLKVAVLKTAVLQGTVGSNPTPSAMSRSMKDEDGMKLRLRDGDIQVALFPRSLLPPSPRVLAGLCRCPRRDSIVQDFALERLGPAYAPNS
jgi:hypothetical protein